MSTPPSPGHSPVSSSLLLHGGGHPAGEAACGPLAPAPYGRACAGCARAKCKCFYRYEGSDCERCHRLGKKCEPSPTVRKRKAQADPTPQSQPQNTTTTTTTTNNNNNTNNSSSSRLEEKLDDLVTLLRSQAVEKAHTPPMAHHHNHNHGSPQSSSYSSSNRHQHGSSPASAGMPTPGTSASSADSPYSSAPAHPDLVISMDGNVVHYLRPAEQPSGAYHSSSSPSSSTVIFNDVAVHNVPEAVAEEGLDAFRRAFVTTFPFVLLPPGLAAAELLLQRPFLWLNVMALTTRMVSRQFAMEETIWQIISRRVVAQQHASLDLLLGVICFASWSHYFKQDKPFMTMLSQVAVSLAFELGIQKDVNGSAARRHPSGGPSQLRAEPPRPAVRTMEERRTILAVFHLTSSTWTSYRKTEPLRWTSYFDECLSVLSEGRETDLDILLATQVKCQTITNSLTCPHFDSFEDETSSLPPAVLMKAMLGRLNDIRQSLPALIRTERTTELYLHSTEITIQESFLTRPPPPLRPHADPTGASHFRRLQDLQSLLVSVERWLGLFLDMPPLHWTGVSMDTFSQLTHALVVLFRLTAPLGAVGAAADPSPGGWDPAEVRRRGGADVLAVLDRAADVAARVPAALGIVDADGPRSGLFFKTAHLFRAIRALFAREMGVVGEQQVLPVGCGRGGGAVSSSSSSDGGGGAGGGLGGAFHSTVGAGSVQDGSVVGGGVGEPALVDDFIMDLSNEPWLSDLLAMGPSFNGGPEAFLYPPYAEY